MRIFFSVGEPSGDIHGGNLIRALREQRPGVDCVGFGGERMQQAGCRLDYPLCQLAVMGVRKVVDHAATFIGLVERANQLFRRQRPDAVVLIDYPGFNWWIARRAQAHGIPVFYFVPPQLWAWAGWRVHKMRRFVDHVLCTLPFEKTWYRERGIDAHYVGHPFYDELQQQTLNTVFLAEHRRRSLPSPMTGEGPGVLGATPEVPSPPPGGGMADTNSPTVGLLPGSRNQEVEHNWSTLYRAAVRIQQARPDTRFLVACYKPHQKATIDDYLRRHEPLPITTHVGRTPEIIELSTAIIHVSGSVALELLWRAKPAAVVYRVGRLLHHIGPWIIHAPYMSLVNLLASKLLCPEFHSYRCESEPIAEHVLTWLNDPIAYEALRQELSALRDRVAQPGACGRAAQHILNTLATARAA